MTVMTLDQALAMYGEDFLRTIRGRIAAQPAAPPAAAPPERDA